MPLEGHCPQSVLRREPAIQDFVDQTVLDGLLGAHEIVAVGIA
jgi:hypothetical protein